MSFQTRLRELHELLEALVAHPSPAALVLGCTDEEMVYVDHTLIQLDAESPADRFLIVGDPFADPTEYVDRIVARLSAVSGRDIPATIDPAVRLRVAFGEILADLPAGDHRLMIALVPARVDDPARFASLAHGLLSGPLPPSLRLVFRAQVDAELFRFAEHSPLAHVFAYRFELPASLVVASVRATAHNPASTPEMRRSALLELAYHDLTHGRYTEVLTVCHDVLASRPNTSTAALAFALRTDALHRTGALHAALASGVNAIRLAVACHALPILHQTAMTLGEIAAELGNRNDAIRCFSIAEHAAPHSEEARAIARERRLALIQDLTC